MLVNKEETMREYVQGYQDFVLEVKDMNIIEQAKKDMKSVVWRLKKASKRRVCPAWSAPTATIP